ncbi:A-kinase anchor protein 9-like [Cricetulus griseus]|uniref:A-kinase anchor protein 9-like n=1 Tax=Cricetulus griseus TaxID=10029 RepID=A0A9J7GLU4_CRIGR|nr:A-kinase anchor protein 9-like [Cricetulus griseus]
MAAAMAGPVGKAGAAGERLARPGRPRSSVCWPLNRSFCSPSPRLAGRRDGGGGEMEEDRVWQGQGKRISLDSSHSEQAAHCSLTHVEMTENDLAGKQHEIEELTQWLEGMRATCGTEVLQRLPLPPGALSYEFVAAIKKQDSIITCLAAHMQQSRKETDQILEEFFQLTERSEKVQFQDQHASETLQSSTHRSAAAELVLLKQQVPDQKQVLEQQYHLLNDYQKKEEELTNEVTSLQEKLKVCEMGTEFPTAMECLQKADKRSVLPLNALNNGREEIGI